VVVPGALTAGDLCDVAAALAPRPLRMEKLVDGLNRRIPIEKTRRTYQPAIQSYRRAKAERQLVFGDASSPVEFLLAEQSEDLSVLSNEVDGAPTKQILSRYLKR